MSEQERNAWCAELRNKYGIAQPEAANDPEDLVERFEDAILAGSFD